MSGRDITQWSPGRAQGLSRLSPQSRDVERRATSIINDARLDGLRIDAGAAVAAKGMERVVDLDNYRHALAGGDEFLNAQLGRIEMAFIASVGQVQRGF